MAVPQSFLRSILDLWAEVSVLQSSVSDCLCMHNLNDRHKHSPERLSVSTLLLCYNALWRASYTRVHLALPTCDLQADLFGASSVSCDFHLFERLRQEFSSFGVMFHGSYMVCSGSLRCRQGLTDRHMQWLSAYEAHKYRWDIGIDSVHGH